MKTKTVAAPMKLVVKNEKDAESAVAQYANIINTYSEKQWELHTIEEIPVEIKGGCLGKKNYTINCNMLVFNSDGDVQPEEIEAGNPSQADMEIDSSSPTLKISEMLTGSSIPVLPVIISAVATILLIVLSNLPAFIAGKNGPAVTNVQVLKLIQKVLTISLFTVPFILFSKGDRKKAISTGIGVLAGILIMTVISFFVKNRNFLYFTKLPDVMSFVVKRTRFMSRHYIFYQRLTLSLSALLIGIATFGITFLAGFLSEKISEIEDVSKKKKKLIIASAISIGVIVLGISATYIVPMAQSIWRHKEEQKQLEEQQKQLEEQKEQARQLFNEYMENLNSAEDIPAPAPSAPAPKTNGYGISVGQILTCNENLRLRSNDSTSGSIITSMQKGTRVEILDFGKVDTSEGVTSTWVLVKTLSGGLDKDGYSIPYGTTGWCFAGFLE